MEELHLSETLQRYFADVFLCCTDVFMTEKALLDKTIELIKSGKVPEDVVLQIGDICWPTTTTHLSKKQFFSALKLVAAHQANLLISSDILTSKIDLPMPRFTWKPLEVPESQEPDLIELRNEGDYDSTASISTDSEVDSETVRCSPDLSSALSDSPTPTNSVQDRNWAISGAWQNLVSEEQRQLLEDESSDRHSSDDDTEHTNEIWTINPEQREYYTNQFKKLQENANALLPGHVARNFFERSQLPVRELRKIWQLSDITKDGALSLQEFMTAMHLVVLRKHNVPIPETLPPSLVPINRPLSPPMVQPTAEPEQIVSPEKKDTGGGAAKEWTKFVDSPTSSVSSPGPKPVNFDFQIDQNDPDLRHPVPRRLTPEISAGLQNNDDIPDAIDLSSPRKSAESNSLHVQHAPYPATPTANAIHSAIQRPQVKKLSVPSRGAIPPPPIASQNSVEEGGPVSLPSFPPPKMEKPPPPPPRPFKTHGRSSSLDLNRLTKPGGPPVVPPRVSPNSHSKKLSSQRSEDQSTTTSHVTTLTPRVADSTGSSFGDFDSNFGQFGSEKYENVQDEVIFPGDLYEAERKKLFEQLFATESEEVPRKHGAFEVYRKPSKHSSSESPLDVLEEEKWEEFERLQIENTALLRTCQELSQTLADLKEEKMKLKVRLEQLESQENGG